MLDDVEPEVDVVSGLPGPHERSFQFVGRSSPDPQDACGDLV